MESGQQFEHQKLSAILALLAHFIVLSTLFLSFIADQKKESELKNPLPSINSHIHPTISAPVVLYSGPIGNQPSVKSSPSIKQPPTAQAVQGTAQTTGIGATKPGSQSQAKPQAEPKKAARIVEVKSTFPLIPDEKAFEALTESKTKVIEPEKEKPKEEKNPEEKQKPVPELFKAADKLSLEELGMPGDIRRRRLTLADLFKTMPHLMKKLSQEAGDGEQLVVVQGDMKYYSFIKTFVEHVNQVFNFHGGPKKLFEFAKEGKIQRQAGLSVVIDREGKVLSARITHSTGHQPADNLLLESMELASPFPPVPSHFTHKTVRVELISVVRS